MGQINTQVIRPDHKILSPAKVPAKTDRFNIYDRPLNVKQWEKYILNPAKGLVALDLETKGIDPIDPENRIVGIGLAWGSSAAYINLDVQDVEVIKQILPRIAELNLVTFNLMFEALQLNYLAQQLGVECNWNWRYDVYVAYKHLGSEGYTGQKWNLKDAAVNLLGWDARHDEELDNWLIDNKYYTLKGKGDAKYKAPKKECMYLAPIEILGHYCMLDCQATLYLHEHVMAPHFDEAYKWVHSDMLYEIQQLATTQIAGMKVDVNRLEALVESYSNTLSKIDDKFNSLDQIQEIKQQMLHADKLKKIEKKWYRKKPEVYKKNGEISKNYIKWAEGVSS